MTKKLKRMDRSAANALVKAVVRRNAAKKNYPMII